MLTIKKHRFIELVVKTGKILESYVNAGYSASCAPNNAYKLYKEPEVSTLIAKQIDKLYNLSQEQWRKQLIGLRDDPDAKVSDKIRIMELYGRHKNYLGTDTTNITVNNIGSSALSTIKRDRIKQNLLSND